MAQILQFLKTENSFGPDAVEALGKAYDMALTALHDVGQPGVVREGIAKRIITEAKHGGRDPAKLCAVALSAFNSNTLTR